MLDTLKNGTKCKTSHYLTVILLTWRIWRVPNNASRWQMGFNSAFKGLIIMNNVTVLSTQKNIYLVTAKYASVSADVGSSILKITEN
jgi:hypothetical protein